MSSFVEGGVSTYPPHYLAAWKKYEASGYRVDLLSAADVEALRSDPQTRSSIDTWRRTQAKAVSAQSSATERAERTEQIASDIDEALAAAVKDGDTAPLSAQLAKHHKHPHIKDAIVEAVMSVLLMRMHQLTTKAKARLDALEAETKQLKSQPAGIQYLGVWSGATKYPVNAAVTFQGSLWIAKTENLSRRPGIGDGSWQLAVKSGKDGKECKCPHCRGEQTTTDRPAVSS